MEDQGKQFKLDEHNYFDYVVNGDVLEITFRDFDIPKAKELMQGAILLAQKGKLKYIVEKKFTDSLDDGIFENCFKGADRVALINKIEFSEDKKDWHKVDESPKNDERLKEKQRIYYRYRV